MATYTFTIGGATKTVQEGWSIVGNLNSRASATFTVRSFNGAYRPTLGASVVIAENGTPIFAGIIRRMKETGALGQPIAHIDTVVDAEDYATVAERRYVTEAFADVTLKTILTRLTTYFASHGITLDVAQVDGPTVTAREYLQRRASDILDELSAETGYIWEIDVNKVFRMYAPGTVTAPFDVEDGDRHALDDMELEPNEGKYGTRVTVMAGGNTPRPIAWSATDNDLDPEASKYYGPGTTIGAFRCWNLSPLVSNILYDSAGGGALKIVDGGIAAFPASLSPLADLLDYGAGKRYFLERTFDVLFDEPTNFWPLNEASGDALDAGSGADDGTVAGSPVRNAIGVTFDGVDDAIGIAGLSAFSATWSWEGVFTPNSAQSDTSGLLFGEASTGAGLRYNKTSGKLEVKGHTGSVLAESSVLVSGTTYKVFVTVSAGAITIYLDGVSAGTGTGWSSTHTPDAIGGDTGFFLKGHLRNVAYYPGVSFTADQVTRHYGRTIDRLMQAASETALGSTDYVAVAYTGAYPVVATAVNDAAEDDRGIEERILESPSLLRWEAAYDMAASVLLQLATPRTVSYQTNEIGLTPGMTQRITNAARNVDADCLAVQVVTRHMGGGVVRRFVKATEGATLQGIWRDTFMGRTDSTGSIGSTPSTPVTPTTTVNQPTCPGANDQIIFNASGSFGADERFTWDRVIGQMAITTENGPAYQQLAIRSGSDEGIAGIWVRDDVRQDLRLGWEWRASGDIARSVMAGGIVNDTSIKLIGYPGQTPGSALDTAAFAHFLINTDGSAVTYTTDGTHWAQLALFTNGSMNLTNDTKDSTFSVGAINLFGSGGADDPLTCQLYISDTLTAPRALQIALGDTNRQMYFDASGFVKWT